MSKTRRVSEIQDKVPRDARTGEFRVIKPYVNSSAASKVRDAVRAVNERLRDRDHPKK